MNNNDQYLLGEAYSRIYEDLGKNLPEDEDNGDGSNRLNEWKKQNEIKGINEYWSERKIFEIYFNKRMAQIAEEISQNAKYGSGRGDYHSDFYNKAFQDDIINDLMNFNLDKDENGDYYVYINKGRKIKGQDDVFYHFYRKFGWYDGEDNDKEENDYDDLYDDPTGQDEPIDNRSYADIEMSDRLDAASRMDPDQAAEFRRGA